MHLHVIRRVVGLAESSSAADVLLDVERVDVGVRQAATSEELPQTHAERPLQRWQKEGMINTVLKCT